MNKYGVQVDRQAKGQINLSFLDPIKIYTGPQEEKNTCIKQK